jgi:hypothetical protein
MPLSATSHSTSNETCQREPAAAALHPWEASVIDIANCQRTEFVMALRPRETAAAWIATWPAEVQASMHQHLNSWMKENKDTRVVHAMTMAAVKHDNVQACVLMLHHTPRG